MAEAFTSEHTWPSLWIALKLREPGGFKSQDAWRLIIEEVNMNHVDNLCWVGWTTVVETPDELLIVIAFKDQAALDHYECSEAWIRHEGALHELTAEGVQPQLQKFYFLGPFWHSATEFTSIIDAYFPAEVSASERRELEELRGLRAFFVPITKGNQYYARPGVRGWSQLDMEGRLLTVMRFVDFWMYEDKEEVFKAQACVVEKDGAKRIWPKFQADLRALGVLRLVERHVAFEEIPRFYGDYGEDEEEAEV